MNAIALPAPAPAPAQARFVPFAPLHPIHHIPGPLEKLIDAAVPALLKDVAAFADETLPGR